MFEVIAWNGQTEVVEIFAERGNADAYAREMEAKEKGLVAYFSRMARG